MAATPSLPLYARTYTYTYLCAHTHTHVRAHTHAQEHTWCTPGKQQLVAAKSSGHRAAARAQQRMWNSIPCRSESSRAGVIT